MCQFSLYNHQVGGHSVCLKSLGNDVNLADFILKPKIQNEYRFYECVNTNQDEHADLLPFLPKYCGTVSVSEEARINVKTLTAEDDENAQQQVLTTDSKKRKAAWMRTLYEKRYSQGDYIKLEDLTRNMVQPCVIDLKIGLNRLSDNILNFTSPELQLGFRICGMQVYQKKRNQAIFHDKYWGRNLEVSSIKDVLEFYFSDGETIQTNMINQVIKQLEQIINIITKKYAAYRFHSSSLLFVYDGHQPVKQQCQVKLIDFANILISPVVSITPDNGFISGVNNIIKVLKLINQQG